jgi:hypothetical protein
MERTWLYAAKLQLSLAPDCPVVHWTVSGTPGWSPMKWLLSGIDDGVRLKITGRSGGAPDCPVSHPRQTRRSREKQWGDVAIIHRTVRWCTGLSGEPNVACAKGRPQNLRVTCGSFNDRQGAPDCPVCTRQCLVRQQARRCNGRLCPIWKEIEHRIGTIAVRWRTGRSGAPLDRRQERPSKLVFNGS